MSTVLAFTANDIIIDALEDIGITPPGQTANPEDTAKCLRIMNRLLKAWQAPPMKLWLQEEGVVFMNPGQQSYLLGPSGDNATKRNDWNLTTVTSDALAGTYTVVVASTEGMESTLGDSTEISLDPDLWSVTDGELLTTTDGLELDSTVAGTSANCGIVVQCEIGHHYHMFFDYLKGTDTGAIFSVIDAFDNSVLATVTKVHSEQNIELDFIATHTSVIFRMKNQATDFESYVLLSAAGDYVSTDSSDRDLHPNINYTIQIDPEDWFVNAPLFNLYATSTSKFMYKGHLAYPGISQFSTMDSSGDQQTSGALLPTSASGTHTVGYLYDAISDFTLYFDGEVIGTQSNPIFTPNTTDLDTLKLGIDTLDSTQYLGKILHFTLEKDSIVTLDMNPADYSTGSTWVSATTGETWTLNGNASIVTNTTLTNTIQSLSQVDLGNGEPIGIELDDGSRYWDSIVEVVSSTEVEINLPLPSDATAGNTVYSYTDEIDRPLHIYNARSSSSINSFELPFDRMWSRQEYIQQPIKTTTGTVLAAYYNPQLGDGRLYVWPTASNINDVVYFTYDEPFEVLETQIDVPQIPAEWAMALQYGIEDKLLGSYTVPADRALMVKEMAMTTLKDARADGSPYSMQVQPRLRR